MVCKHSDFIRFNVKLICRLYVKFKSMNKVLDQYESLTGAALVLDAPKVTEI